MAAGSAAASEHKPLDLRTLNEMLDIADADRRLQAAVSEELDFDARKAAIREHLRNTYAAMGMEGVSDAVLDKAIDEYFDSQHVFQEPAKTFETRLATWYVNRAKNARKYGIPAGKIAGIGAIFGAAIYGFVQLSIVERESSMESLAQGFLSDKIGLEVSIERVTNSDFKNRLPSGEVPDFETHLATSRGRLIDIDPFFKKYCPGGNCQDGITGENYKTVEGIIDSIDEGLNLARMSFEQSQAILDNQHNLEQIATQLNTLIKQTLTLPNLPNRLLEAADSAYKRGITSVEGRDTEIAAQYVRELDEIYSGARQLPDLIAKSKQHYTAIMQIARVDEARESAEALFAESKKYASEADIGRLQSSVDSLRALDARLSQEYILVAFGGDWRYPNDNPNVKAHYILVESRDANGNAVPVLITNIENGTTSLVCAWGERVPESVYNRVGNDKKDDGIINNNNFGVKQRGYLDIKYNSDFTPEGSQITSWSAGASTPNPCPR